MMIPVTPPIIAAAATAMTIATAATPKTPTPVKAGEWKEMRFIPRPGDEKEEAIEQAVGDCYRCSNYISCCGHFCAKTGRNLKVPIRGCPCKDTKRF